MDLSSIASGLTSGLQGLQQPSTLQSQLSNAGSVINSAVSGVLNVGGQGSSQVGQLLNTAQQVAGQLPGISNLQSTGTQIVSSALNSILPQLMGSFLTGRYHLHIAASQLRSSIQLVKIMLPLADWQTVFIWSMTTPPQIFHPNGSAMWAETMVCPIETAV